MNNAKTYNVPRDSSASNVGESLYVFNELRESWEMETGVLSNPHAITTSPSFNAIVDMGQKAVPYIIEDIKQSPSFLFVALERIYSDHLAVTQKTGVWQSVNVKESCRRWIERLDK